jgi:hypothetical protein
VVEDVGFFPDVVVVGQVVDVVLSGGSGSWVTVVVGGGAVVVVGRFVVVVVAGARVVVVAGGCVVVVGACVVVVVGASVVVVAGGSVDVVVSGGGGSVVVPSSGGTASGGAVSGGDVGSGVGQSTGWAGSAGGGHSSAPAISVAKGAAGPTPDPAAPKRTAPAIRATVIRRWAEDVDTGLTSSRKRAYPALFARSVAACPLVTPVGRIRSGRDGP